MKAGDRARCSTRRRRRLPVPLAQVPTVFPVATPRKTQPKGGTFRVFLKRLRDRMPRFVFVPGNRNRMWRHGETNPATGLPMYGGVDSAGNPYGTDLRTSWIRTSDHSNVHAQDQGALPNVPPFHSEWDEPRVTMESIDHRW